MDQKTIDAFMKDIITALYENRNEQGERFITEDNYYELMEKDLFKC